MAFVPTNAVVVVRPPDIRVGGGGGGGGKEVATHDETTRASSTKTQLSMVGSGGGNLVDRFSRVVRGNVNRLVSSLEDPEKVIVQSVTDMQNDLVKLRSSQSQVKAEWQRSLRKQQHLKKEAAQWYQRAQLALRQDEESLARQALTRRAELMTQSEALQVTLDGQTKMLEQLDTALDALEQRIYQAQSQKNQLVARAKTAKTTQKVNDMLSATVSSALGGSKTSMAAFVRMQERVEAMEAAAEASSINRMAPSSGATARVSDDLEMKFQLLEAQSTVDLELEKLKSTMTRGALLGPAKQQSETVPGVRLPSLEQQREVIRIPVTTENSKK
jgi:phage shock protein A